MALRERSSEPADRRLAEAELTLPDECRILAVRTSVAWDPNRVILAHALYLGLLRAQELEAQNRIGQLAAVKLGNIGGRHRREPRVVRDR